MTVRMFMTPRPVVKRRFSDWPLAAKSILGFWFFYALTVVARAFLGSDPWTTLENKLAVIAIGMALTGLIYLALATRRADAGIRRKAVIAAIASAIASLVMGVSLITLQDVLRESKEEFRFQAREGFTVIEQGQQVRIERTAQEPLVLTMPKNNELDPKKRIRYALDASVVWLFFFLAWSAFYPPTRPRPKSLAPSASWPTPKARHRPHRSERFDTRSIRTSCSTRSTRCPRW